MTTFLYYAIQTSVVVWLFGAIVWGLITGFFTGLAAWDYLEEQSGTRPAREYAEQVADWGKLFIAAPVWPIIAIRWAFKVVARIRNDLPKPEPKPVTSAGTDSKFINLIKRRV